MHSIIDEMKLNIKIVKIWKVQLGKHSSTRIKESIIKEYEKDTR